MQQSDIPTISVAMGVLYKRESLSLLQRSVSSIQNQSYQDLELLICDDGSTQEAKRFLDECSRQDNRIRLLRPGNKLDLASKLNVCLHDARGKYVARMDDDDYSLPERFQRQIEMLEKRPDIAFVGSNVSLICCGQRCGERIFPEYPTIRDFFMTQPFIHPSLIFRREALEAAGGYSEDRRQVLCEDYDLLLRLYAKGFRGMNLREKLLDYTIPAPGTGSRRMRHRWNEAVTRWQRFRELGVLPRALPYVAKPIAAGLIPKSVLERAKHYGS